MDPPPRARSGTGGGRASPTEGRVQVAKPGTHPLRPSSRDRRRARCHAHRPVSELLAGAEGVFAAGAKAAGAEAAHLHPVASSTAWGYALVFLPLTLPRALIGSPCPEIGRAHV